MKPIDTGINMSDMTWAFSEIRQATFGYFEIDMEIANMKTGDIDIS